MEQVHASTSRITPIRNAGDVDLSRSCRVAFPTAALLAAVRAGRRTVWVRFHGAAMSLQFDLDCVVDCDMIPVLFVDLSMHSSSHDDLWSVT